jgi:hypothetical protein
MNIREPDLEAQLSEARQTIVLLKEENEQFKDTLRFYSAHVSYTPVDSNDPESRPVLRDDGMKARSALRGVAKPKLWPDPTPEELGAAALGEWT